MTKLRKELPEAARISRVEQDCVDMSNVGQSSFAISGRDQLVGAVTVETWTSEEGVFESPRGYTSFSSVLNVNLADKYSECKCVNTFYRRVSLRA